MDWMLINDGLGEPISTDGMYQRLTDLPNANAKARFMRDYRLLPYGARDYWHLCDDARELDTMRGVMDVCARLAAISAGMGDGARKATTDDLELVPGFERAKGGAFLHINLENSYWYKRYLYDVLDARFEGVIWRPISQRALIDDDCQRDICGGNWSNAEVERLKADSGTFEYSTAMSAELLETLNEADREIYGPSILNDITSRLAFRSFTPIQDLRYPLTSKTYECKLEAGFWTDNELVIRCAGDDLRGIAGDIAQILLDMHAGKTRHEFTFRDGFRLFAPMSICALWCDFAQDVAKRPICICRYCGRPIVENHPPRGHPRKYCDNACRMKDKRREKKRAQELARATG